MLPKNAFYMVLSASILLYMISKRFIVSAKQAEDFIWLFSETSSAFFVRALTMSFNKRYGEDQLSDMQRTILKVNYILGC